MIMFLGCVIGFGAVFQLLNVVFMIHPAAIEFDHLFFRSVDVIGDIEEISSLIKELQLSFGDVKDFLQNDQPIYLFTFSRLIEKARPYTQIPCGYF